MVQHREANYRVSVRPRRGVQLPINVTGSSLERGDSSAVTFATFSSRWLVNWLNTYVAIVAHTDHEVPLDIESYSHARTKVNPDCWAGLRVRI